MTEIFAMSVTRRGHTFIAHGASDDEGKTWDAISFIDGKEYLVTEGLAGLMGLMSWCKAMAIDFDKEPKSDPASTFGA